MKGRAGVWDMTEQPRFGYGKKSAHDSKARVSARWPDVATGVLVSRSNLVTRDRPHFSICAMHNGYA